MVKAERIRIYDVARVAGVSVATASKALNDTGRMTEETRKRVKQTAAALGFRPNAMARALTQQRSFTIGLLTNDTYGRFTLPVMAGVTVLVLLFAFNLRGTRRVNRVEGVALLAIYVAYTVWLLS